MSMIRKIIAIVILLPLGLLILALAMANREIVTVSFDPFSTTDRAFELRLPLYMLLFVLVIAGVIIGGIAAWLKQAKTRRAARRLESELRQARAEAQQLRERLAAAESARTAPSARLALRPPAA